MRCHSVGLILQFLYAQVVYYIRVIIRICLYYVMLLLICSLSVLLVNKDISFLLYGTAADHRDVKPASSSSAIVSPSGTAHQQNSKKLIGIRYLFPAFDERVTLLERARVWVARHDHKYFVDWTEDQMKTVSPALRPYAPITRDLYKLHMNRYLFTSKRLVT